MGYFSDIYKSAVSILQGMSATIKVYFSPPATIQYPFEPSKTQPTFRGVVVHLTDLATGKPKCTGCTLCAKACPAQAIHIETSRGEDKKIRVDRFAIDNGHCLVCNLCVEACNFGALYMAPKWNTMTEVPEELIWEYDKLLEWGMPYSKAEEPKKPAAVPGDGAKGGVAQ